ncbi:MAG: hypothetical protein LBC98_01020, partial [Prevotellaceae bacterium]|nr:hypothetical protein [Prevotellaceae bacterium]
MKKILGLDLGTNSIGWALIDLDFETKDGKIWGMGSRIIPMSQDILGNFDAGKLKCHNFQVILSRHKKTSHGVRGTKVQSTSAYSLV